MRRALLAIVVGVASCTSSPWAFSANPENQADRADTIYVVAPFSGNLRNFALQVQNGVEAALAEWNQDASREPVKAEFLDDSCDPEKAKRIADQLVTLHARVVLGHVCSVTSLPASLIYAKAGIPMLSAASSNAALTDRDIPSVFRVAGRDDSQAPLAAETIATRFSGQRVAIVEETDVTGRGHGEHVKEALARRKIEPVAMLDVSSPDDIPTIVEKLQEDHAQVVFYGGHQAALLGALLNAARASKVSAQFISNDGAGNKLVQDTAKEAINGLLFTFDRSYAQADSAKVAVARLKSQGKTPEGFTLNAYASTQILLQTLSRNRTATGPQLTQYLHDTRFATAIGDVGFNSKGDVDTPQEALFQWRAGEIVPD